MTIILQDAHPLHELHDAVYRQQSEFSQRTDASVIRDVVRSRLDPAQFDLVLNGMPKPMQDFITLRYLTKPKRSMLDIAQLMGMSNNQLTSLSIRVLHYLSHPATRRRYERLPVSVFEEIDARCAEAERFATDNERLYAVLHHLMNGHITPSQLELRPVEPVHPSRYAEETPLEFIHFRYADYNTLRRWNFETVEDILRIGGHALLSYRNIGPTVVARIRATLDAHHFTLTDEPQVIAPINCAVLAASLPPMQTVADIDNAVQRAQHNPDARVVVDLYPRFADTWAGVLTLTGRK